MIQLYKPHLLEKEMNKEPDDLRNTQGKIYVTYLGNRYEIYKEYIRIIHKYL